MRAAFVSTNRELLERLHDEFDLVISDRDNLSDVCENKFLNLEHDEGRIFEVLESKGVSTAVCLGYRRLFSGRILAESSCKFYNLHPSVLPAFKGLNVYERVLNRGVNVSGATLHQVEEEVDEGEIIDQITYHVREDMDAEELKRYAAKFEARLVRANLEKL